MYSTRATNHVASLYTTTEILTTYHASILASTYKCDISLIYECTVHFNKY